jgi:tetratricopeptide (TPR) repeat protein
MWNFAGKQNDIQGHGEINKGNWLSGIPFIDEFRLGPQDNISSEMANNKGRNKYYMLPLILGLIGLFFHFKAHNKDALVVTLLFLFTGLAIVVYLNQYPFQPRERDYAYVGSFYAFCIWIGIGVMAIFDFLSNKLDRKSSSIIATLACLLLVPTLMASENWDDHDRSNRYTARDVASNYLNSCAPNAIIFTNGDNDTFPLWYAQEVEGIRTDIRVVNLSLFNTDWYVDQMRRAAYDAGPIPSSLDWNKYKQGTRDYIPIFEDPRFEKFDYIEVSDAIKWIGSDSENRKIPTQRGKSNYCPTRKLKITVNKEEILEKGIVSADKADLIVDEIRWELKGSGFQKNQLMVLDILANFNWDRPIYFAITVGGDNFMGLDKYFQLEGLAYRFVPYKTISSDGQTGSVASDVMYENVINKFKWGNMQDPNIYLDETNRRMTFNFRNNFARLAEELIRKGELEKAEKTLDKCFEVMPHEAISYNYFVLPLAEAYYKIGKKEKGREILEILVDHYFEELAYFKSLKPVQLNSMQRDYQVTEQVIRNLYSIANENQEKELFEKIAQRYEELQ